MIHRRLIAKGIKYYLTLPHNTGHGIHSPFLFRLINEVFSKDIDYDVFRKIENYRQQLIWSNEKLLVSELGARSSSRSGYKKIKNIAQKESTPHHYGRLLYNLAREFKPENMLELGTCLGMGTLYLALGNPSGKVFSIEGSAEKVSLASSMLQKEAPNAEIFTGNFDEQLPKVLQAAGKIDLAFIDGNHNKESTLKYFNDILEYSHENTVFVFDDINWSPGMMEAWGEIQNHPKTRVSMDLFRMGIVLLNPKLQKESFTLFY